MERNWVLLPYLGTTLAQKGPRRALCPQIATAKRAQTGLRKKTRHPKRPPRKRPQKDLQKRATEKSPGGLKPYVFQCFWPPVPRRAWGCRAHWAPLWTPRELGLYVYYALVLTRNINCSRFRAEVAPTYLSN